MFFILSCGWGAAALAASDAPAAMKYTTVSGFGSSASADFRFDLLAGDYDLTDNCDDLALAAVSAAKENTDTIMLAKLDNEKKPRSSHGKSSARNSAPVEEPTPIASRTTPADPSDQEWEIIVSDKTLNAAMARWAASAGWQLLWELPVDYAVEARTSVRGTFEEAVSTVAKSMESAEIPMKAVFYQGNKVLRIMAKGSE